MIYYANPSTETIRDAMMRGDLGCITTPAQGNIVFPSEWDVIADNGCFSDRWSEVAWLKWLLDQSRSVRFAVCPDVVRLDGAPSHEPTLQRWHKYAPLMQRHGFKVAFVAQVGATPDTIPSDCDAVFLGGTTEWKLSDTAEAIARTCGKWVHMGRVNSQRRFDAARRMGCDSVDGTYLTFGPDVNLPRLMRWIATAHQQPHLWEETAHRPKDLTPCRSSGDNPKCRP